MGRTPIFVGGTGRCGTTVVHDILAESDDVGCRAEAEVRLHVDPGGLLDVYDALARRWTPYRADAALERFEAFVMRHDLPLHRDEEEDVDLIERLWDELGVPGWERSVRMDANYRKGHSMNVPLLAKEWRSTRFADREEIARSAVRYAFEGLYPHGFDWIVESTPENVLAQEELRDVWPKARFVHVIRDPMDVVASMLEHAGTYWPDDFEAILLHVRDTLHAVAGTKTVDVYLRDLVDDPRGTISALCSRLGVDPSSPLRRMTVKVGTRNFHRGRWRDDLTKSQARDAQEFLYGVREFYGFDGPE